MNNQQSCEDCAWYYPLSLNCGTCEQGEKTGVISGKSPVCNHLVNRMREENEEANQSSNS